LNLYRRLTLPPRSHAVALAVAALAAAGCSTVENVLSGDKVDYRSQSAKTVPLEVPPDLTQLARDGRYRPQSGPVSASGAAAAASAAAPAQAAVAPKSIGDIRVERDGNQRWLVVPMTPEQLWPQLRAFWLERGFTIEIENAQTGVMETNWAENRAKLPQDWIRSTIGRVFDALYSTSERDRFRTRVERTAGGSEVYISHRGMQEVYNSQQRDSTVWQPRPADPQLEAEFLSRLMVKLGTPAQAARTEVAKAPEAAPRPTPPPADATSITLDDGFDRAWRRVGLALDRSGFTVEDRDRSAGLYYVRYVDPKTAGTEEPGFFSRLFGAKEATPLRYRVLVKSEGNRSQVSVQNAQGAPETGEAAKRIVGLISADLR
jgi:outer membrane protein assembly factor BamC